MKHNSTRQANGLWKCRISTGRKVPKKNNPLESKYEYIQKNGFQTRKLAEEWGYKTCSQLEGGLHNQSTMQLVDFWNYWFPMHCENGTQGKPLAPRTAKRYEAIFHSHINPSMGGVRLKAIHGSHIRALLHGMLDIGRSRSTCLHTYRLISLMLKQATKEGFVITNVAQHVTPPKPPKLTNEEREDQVLTHKQQVELLRLAESDAFYVGTWTNDHLFNNYQRYTMIRLAIELGLRMGEIMALKFSDVIPSTEKVGGKFVYVLKVQRATDGEGGTKLPKNGNTRRIPLDQDLLEYIWAYKKWLESWSANEEGFKNNDWVIPNREGSLFVRHNTKSHQMKLLFKRADLPERFTFHNLRHTAITNWLAHEPNIKLVSTMAGHSNVGITLDLYGHVLESNAIDSMDNLYSTMRNIRSLTKVDN